MATRFTEPLFSQSIPAILELTGLSYGELKEDAEIYSTARGQKAANFKASWKKWEGGKNMSLKIESFIRDFYGDLFEEPNSTVSNPSPVPAQIIGSEPQLPSSHREDPRWQALTTEYAELPVDQVGRKIIVAMDLRSIENGYEQLPERIAIVAATLSESSAGSVLSAAELQSLSRSIAHALI